MLAENTAAELESGSGVGQVRFDDTLESAVSSDEPDFETLSEEFDMVAIVAFERKLVCNFLFF